jgi:hypothetical protein
MVPVKDLNTHVRYELPKSDEGFKTPDIFVPMEMEGVVAETNAFQKYIDQIEQKLDMVTSAKPNLLTSKNDDWYYNLNSIKDVKTGISVSVMVRLEILGLDKSSIRKYVTDHILDTAPHDTRLMLAKHVLEPGFRPATPMEKHIVEYFNYLVYKENGINGLLLMKDKAPLVFYKIDDWSEYSLGEFVQCKSMFEQRMSVDKTDMADMVGFVNTFVGKDNVAMSVFRVKNMKQERNNKGAYILNEKKADIVKRVNNILKLAQQPFSFDDEKTAESNRNTDDISQIAFAGMFELLIRKYNDEQASNKVWFLRPEQATFLKVENM